jgi:hypothetical protein
LHGAYFDVATGVMFVRDGAAYVEATALGADRPAAELLLAKDVGRGAA